MEEPLSQALRRSLKARAHRLHPVVSVAAAELSDGVMAEIERSLTAHELIKIKLTRAERPQRDALLIQICRRTGALAVQHIGKILVVYRENPKPAAPAPETPARTKSRPSSRAARNRAVAARPRPAARRQR